MEQATDFPGIAFGTANIALHTDRTSMIGRYGRCQVARSNWIGRTESISWVPGRRLIGLLQSISRVRNTRQNCVLCGMRALSVMRSASAPAIVASVPGLRYWRYIERFRSRGEHVT